MLLKRKILILSVFIFFISVLSGGSYKALFNFDEFVENNKHLIVEEKGKYISIFPASEEVTDGFIFYPGAKVEVKSYVPLMAKIAEQGIACFIVKMPSDLAILAPSRANIVLNNDEYSNIQNWSIGGHSLGGVKASSFAKKNKRINSGLIFLASYTVDDLSKTKLPVLSIYGDRDGVLNLESYEKNKKNLPEKYTEIIIDGGNHAGFGIYGPQKRDNPATMANQEQILFTANKIVEFLRNKNYLL